MLSIHIKHLLNTNSRVIIPDLGAFILKGDSSIIYFNEFLRFNDGILVDYIAETEQIEKAEANKQVKSFVETINQKLTSDKQIAIEGIGLLYYDANEKLQLKTDGESFSAPIQERQPTPKALDPEVEIKKPEPPVEPTPPPKAEPVVSKTEPTPAPPKAATPPEQVVIKKEPPVVAKTLEPEIKASPKPAEKIIPKPKAKPAESTTATTKTSGNTKLYALLAVVAMVLVVLVYFFLIRPAKHVKDNKEFTYEEAQKTDSTAKDSIAKAKPKNVAAAGHASTKLIAKATAAPKAAETKVKTVTKPAKAHAEKVTTPSGGKKYYLVAGCFSVEANADKYVTKLKGEGFDAEKFANIKNMYHVSFASFSDKSSANLEMAKLRESGHEQVWVLSY